MSLEWRSNVPSGLVKLAVGRCLIATMDATRWLELGTITATRAQIQDHPRLLRSLRFGDDDYDACALELTPVVLGEQAFDGTVRDLAHLEVVSEFLDLAAWLASNDESMFRRLFEVDDAAGSVMSDGTVMTAIETAAVRLDVAEMRRQVTRIRRDHQDDPEAAVGAAKELIETVCKTILGLVGDSDTRDDVPKLVKQTMVHLGLDPATVANDGRDTAEAHALRRVVGGVASIVNGADELRNARGTGHGRSGSPLVDEALARLTVGSVLPAVVFLVEVFEQRMTPQPAAVSALEDSAFRVSLGDLGIGGFVEHETFGEGQVVNLEGTGDKLVATIEFGVDAGVKRLLVRYAPLRLVRSASPGDA